MLGSKFKSAVRVWEGCCTSEDPGEGGRGRGTDVCDEDLTLGDGGCWRACWRCYVPSSRMVMTMVVPVASRFCMAAVCCCCCCCSINAL